MNSEPIDNFDRMQKEANSSHKHRKEKGDWFEELIKSYLENGPEYGDTIGQVWIWDEWPHRDQFGGNDKGIDLVAIDADTGEYWAIQCKNYDPSYSVSKPDIDTFISLSGKSFHIKGVKHEFARRILIIATDNINRNAEVTLKEQNPPVTIIRRKDLNESLADWGAFDPSKPSAEPQTEPRPIRPYQNDAINATIEGFKTHDRGHIIMACGTGKTFTTLRLIEKMTPKNARILFLAPSLSLVSQSLREWSQQKTQPFRAHAVCSDTSIGKENEDINILELPFPATTDPADLIRQTSSENPDKRTIIFSTYHSIDVVGKAQNMGLGDFDLIICDEAHRTTGIAKEDDTTGQAKATHFQKVHSNDNVRAKKRLYMTATPRIYTEDSKAAAGERKYALYSMDDESLYGPRFYKIGFGEAAEAGWLSEYKVLIVAVDEKDMSAVTNTYSNVYKTDDTKGITHELATQIIGSWKGLSKSDAQVVNEEGHTSDLSEDTQSMRRAVAFSSSIKRSKQKCDIFSKMTNMIHESMTEEQGEGLLDCELQHVDGTMSAGERSRKLDWLKQDPPEGGCRVLSNAKCLSEGVDVPALDSVIFFDTKDSVVDIVQAVGRVMRKADNKQYGYVILPVCIPSAEVSDYNDYIDKDKAFKGIWKVLKALRAHDERLVDEAVFREKITIISGSETEKSDEAMEPSQLDFPFLPIEEISEAVYAVIPRKLGDLQYWSEWAKDAANTAKRLKSRIENMLKDSQTRNAFDNFLKGLHDNINPEITEDEAIEMLTQHILTRPIFDKLFEGYDFATQNPVSLAMQEVIDEMDKARIDSETEDLQKFYDNVAERISHAKSDKSKQDIIRNLYDTFFQTAFPEMTKRLGIVYTPVEIVDFIINSVESALRTHFASSLNDKDVQILDPFTGTGTFITRLIQSGHIRESLPHKFAHEIHANETVLLAYYIAALNIESAYYELIQTHTPFEGIVLTDSFQMHESTDMVDDATLHGNSERVNRQKLTPIRVIMGNPPYSSGQTTENDNNKNLNYPNLDEEIQKNYAAKSRARLKIGLKDSYIRAIRLASNRIADKGIVAFVSNGSFLDSNVTDGLRKCLMEEFSHLYIFNLRGNQRTAGEISKREGGKIFGSGSRAPIAISILIKDPNYTGEANLHYYDIGDYLTREEKLNIIDEFNNIDNIDWKNIIPNDAGDWINLRDPAFDKFIPIGDKSNKKERAIFSIYSRGVITTRDFWVYNFSKEMVFDNMQRMIMNYNTEREKYFKIASTKIKKERPSVESIVNSDSKYISWSGDLKNKLVSNHQGEFDAENIIYAMYRPFCCQYLYYDKVFNNSIYQLQKLFPTPTHENIVISVQGIGANKDFSALATNFLPDLELVTKGQCFPLYWYEESGNHGNSEGQADEAGYIKREAIRDWAWKEFREHYNDESISKEDIFWYIYGILHSPEYKQRFNDTLKKMLPRIPFAKDFKAFCIAGKQLGDIHLNYETATPYKATIQKPLIAEETDYTVKKMAFDKFRNAEGKLAVDKTTIKYNDKIIISNIPMEAYNYVVNGKSAIEWIMERYQMTRDKASHIPNNPNDWSEDPEYILNLLLRIITISLETNTIIKTLPKLEI